MLTEDLVERLTVLADRLKSDDERAFLKGGCCVTLQREETEDMIRILRDARDALSAHIEE